MGAVTFNEVFSAATAAFTQNTDLYYQLYSKHMGVRQDPPAFTNDDFPWPEIDFKHPNVPTPFTTGKLVIGTYARAPYNSLPDAEGNRTGFEVDFVKAIISEINNKYPEALDIEEEWFDVPIADDELYWDGTEPLVISAKLKERLGIDYDMILSGYLVALNAFDGDDSGESGGGPDNQTCSCCGQELPDPAEETGAEPAILTANCAPYSFFHIGACYCGDKALERTPEPNNDVVYEVLGHFSATEDRSLVLTHTNSLSDPSRANNSSQSQTADEVIAGIIKAGGQAESQPRLVWGIIDGIRSSTADMYVGDGLQIQVMNMNRSRDEFAHVIDLGLRWSDMYMAPITLEGW